MYVQTVYALSDTRPDRPTAESFDKETFEIKGLSAPWEQGRLKYAEEDTKENANNLWQSTMVIGDNNDDVRFTAPLDIASKSMFNDEFDLIVSLNLHPDTGLKKTSLSLKNVRSDDEEFAKGLGTKVTRIASIVADLLTTKVLTKEQKEAIENLDKLMEIESPNSI